MADPIGAPTRHEIEVLRMLAGEREGEWGAWVGACLEYLQANGFCTRGPTYRITDKGRAALKAADAKRKEMEKE